ncbi:hypothetical protein ACFWWN_10690, partial [Streptomyces sp. NPDC059082]
MRTTIDRGTARGLPEWDRCAVMGVVNVTPDSFSDGGPRGRTTRRRTPPGACSQNSRRPGQN